VIRVSAATSLITWRWPTGRPATAGRHLRFGLSSRWYCIPAQQSFTTRRRSSKDSRRTAQPDGSVALFRPEMNAARFQSSARRLALPELPADMFVDSVQSLLLADLDWVPPGEHEASLYIRPFMIATEPFLGVRPAREVRYGAIASPAGAYFAAGAGGITLWLAAEFARAAPGGTGAAKCGGNYAASLLPQMRALEQGCDQVLYTVDGVSPVEWCNSSA